MADLPLTRACVLVPAAAFLDRLGRSIVPLLGSVGLPATALASPDLLVPTVAAARLLRNAARREGIDAFGALAGGGCGLEALGVFGTTICAAPTLRDALRIAVAERRLFSSSSRLWLREQGADVKLCHAFATGGDPVWRQAEHYVLRLLVEVLRLGAGPAWRPPRVQLQTPEWPVLRSVDAFAEARLDFSQPIGAVTFPQRLLDAPLPAPATRCTPLEVSVWRATGPAPTFAEAVAQVVEMLTWKRPPRVGETAAALGTTRRTLQRRLASSGVTHERLVDRARLASAASLLADTDARILDVALDVGYSDHAHFTRAFRRWSGLSPRDYRRMHRDDAAVRATAPAAMQGG